MLISDYSTQDRELAEELAEIKRLMRKGLPPSFIDDYLGKDKGYTHDVIIWRWQRSGGIL